LEQGNGETWFPHLLRMRAGGPRTQAPARGRVWEGAALTQGDGETGFPHSPTRWEGDGYALTQGDGGTGFPHAPARGKVRATPSRRGMRKPGFPVPPPGGRVWEGCALPRRMFIPSVRGLAAWMATVNIVS